ncbi:MAG: rod-binding protein [Bdellovibrionales bacterium]
MEIKRFLPLKPKDVESLRKEQDQQLRQAAKMYESHFLNEMVKAMRSTVQRDGGIMQPNFAEKIFSEQLDQQYVQGWSESGGVGLADMIYDQVRERYMESSKQKWTHPKGPLPLAPAQDIKELAPANSIRVKSLPGVKGAGLGVRMEVMEPGQAAYDAIAPLSGEVLEMKGLGEGWQMVQLDHGRGVRSELTFPGAMTELGAGTRVEAGQKLGVLDSGRPVLAWNLDWSS